MTSFNKSNIAAILDEVAATSSKNEKIAILTREKANTLLRDS